MADAWGIFLQGLAQGMDAGRRARTEREAREQGEQHWQQDFGLRQAGQQADIAENLARRLQSGQQFDATMQQRGLEDSLSRMDAATANTQRLAQQSTALTMARNQQETERARALMEQKRQVEARQVALGLKPAAVPPVPTALPVGNLPGAPQYADALKLRTPGLMPAAVPSVPPAPTALSSQDAFRRLFAENPEDAARYATGMDRLTEYTIPGPDGKPMAVDAVTRRQYADRLINPDQQLVTRVVKGADGKQREVTLTREKWMEVDAAAAKAKPPAPKIHVGAGGVGTLKPAGGTVIPPPPQWAQGGAGTALSLPALPEGDYDPATLARLQLEQTRILDARRARADANAAKARKDVAAKAAATKKEAERKAKAIPTSGKIVSQHFIPGEAEPYTEADKEGKPVGKVRRAPEPRLYTTPDGQVLRLKPGHGPEWKAKLADAYVREAPPAVRRVHAELGKGREVSVMVDAWVRGGGKSVAAVANGLRGYERIQPLPLPGIVQSAVKDAIKDGWTKEAARARVLQAYVEASAAGTPRENLDAAAANALRRTFKKTNAPVPGGG